MKNTYTGKTSVSCKDLHLIHPVFGRLSFEGLAALLSNSSFLMLNSTHKVYQEGDTVRSFYMVVCGGLEMCNGDTGRSLPFGKLRAG